MQQASFRRRRAIGVTGAEIPELSRITRKGGVIERQGQSCAGAGLDRPAHAVDRGNEPRMIGLAADAERTRQIRRADRQQVDALDRGDLIDPLDGRHVLDHAGEEDLAVGLRHMLDERDPSIIGGPAAGRHPPLAERRITHRLYCRARSLGAADMRHLDALHAHVQQSQDEGRVEAWRADDRCDADTLGRHNCELHIVQIVGGVLHVDEGGVETREPDDLDDLRIGDPADMGAEREPAFTQYPLYPILLHSSLPCWEPYWDRASSLRKNDREALLVRYPAGWELK